jgi:hypothetical protein
VQEISIRIDDIRFTKLGLDKVHNLLKVPFSLIDSIGDLSVRHSVHMSAQSRDVNISGGAVASHEGASRHCHVLSRFTLFTSTIFLDIFD